MLNRKTVIATALSILCSGAIAATPTIASLSLGDNTAGIAFDPMLRYAFVTNYDNGTVSEIDVDTLAIVAEIPAGDNPRRIVSSAALDRVYFVNDTAPGYLTVLDATSNSVIARVRVGDRPRNIAADFQKGRIYVSNRDSDSISIVDVATNSVVAIVPTGRRPGGIDVNSSLGRIYVVSAQDRTLTVVDQNNPDAQWSVPVGRNPGTATVDERTGKVYVNNVDDATVSVLDGDGRLVTTVPAGAGSTFGAVSAIYRRYYLPNADDGTLTIVDTDQDAVVSTVPMGASPQQAVVDASAGKIYVANRAGNTVTVIDAATETVERTFDVGVNPWRVATAMGKVLVLNENGAAADSLTVASPPQSVDPTAVVTEYFHAASGGYFHTADPLENRLLTDGVFGDDWKRTMQFWRVWTTPAVGRVAVCRFNGSVAEDSADHVFLANGRACERLKASGSWHYEGVGYYVALPNASSQCAQPTVPLYRLIHRDASGSVKYRFTTDSDVIASMQASGLLPAGGNAVFACVPELRAKVQVVDDNGAQGANAGAREKPDVRPTRRPPFVNVHLP